MGRPLGENQFGSAAHTTTTTTTNAAPVVAPHHSSHDRHSHDASHSEHTGGSGAHTFGRSGAGEAQPMHSAAGTQLHAHKEGVFEYVRLDLLSA